MTNELLIAYGLISRGRRYTGMTGCPLPLSLTDIDRYLSARPTAISRKEFDAAIFALDDLFREEWVREQEIRKQ
ncbi:hypothetical protein [Providencia rettgeri]|uniref:hypothetical protein n=1 Tax=Providencia rettgeri TaxID=587 RepID=UPI002360E345|nr:hypothetical protein [Providencia rettgeri]